MRQFMACLLLVGSIVSAHADDPFAKQKEWKACVEQNANDFTQGTLEAADVIVHGAYGMCFAKLSEYYVALSALTKEPVDVKSANNFARKVEEDSFNGFIAHVLSVRLMTGARPPHP